MEINLLDYNFKNSELLYQDFVKNEIDTNKDYFKSETRTFQDLPVFPIYIAKRSEEEKKKDFVYAIRILKKHYIQSDRDIHLNGEFWYAYLILTKRDYLIEQYPQILESKKDFDNIVTKKFDWENYIYKCVLAAEYIEDLHLSEQEELIKIQQIVENLDIYNYLIKYSLFRTSSFITKFLNIIDKYDLSAIMKAKVINRPDLGKDERIGRRILQELNNQYPTLMSPLLSEDELFTEIKRILAQYEGFYK